MPIEFITFYRKCNRCGDVKKYKTQDLDLVKETTIPHKCGGEYEYAGTEMPTVEPEPNESKPAPKLESTEAKSADTSDTSEINLDPIKKIEAVFECNKCQALLKISGESIEKAQKLTFPHIDCKNPEKGTFKFLTVVGRAVGSSGQYSNKRIKKIQDFICNICPNNPIGKWYKHEDPCPKPYDLLGVCYLENLEYRYLRSGNLPTQSTLKISDDVKDVIVKIGEHQVSLNDIKRLFINRFDRYSLQNPDAPEKFPDVKEPLTDSILLKSLLGGITIGIRAINPDDNTIKWVCWDIDADHNENPRLVADTMIKYLKEWYGFIVILENSGSPDSYHVWVSLEPTDNDLAYEFDQSFKSRIKAVLNSMGIQTGEHSIDRGVQKGEGGMIKMPFNFQLKNGVRSEFLADLSKIQPQKLPV
jgi:hypothetical protein